MRYLFGTCLLSLGFVLSIGHAYANDGKPVGSSSGSSPNVTTETIVHEDHTAEYHTPTAKVCVPTCDVKKTVKVEHECKKVDYCLPKCTVLSLLTLGKCDGCKVCSKPKTKNVLIKHLVDEEHCVRKCEVQHVPCNPPCASAQIEVMPHATPHVEHMPHVVPQGQSIPQGVYSPPPPAPVQHLPYPGK